MGTVIASGFTLGNTIRKRMALPPLLSLSFLVYQFYRLSNSHNMAVFVYSVSKIVYNLKPCVIDLREQLVRRKHMPCYPVDKASLITYES